MAYPSRLRSRLFVGAFALLCAVPCRADDAVARTGDEIVVAGRFVHTGTRVVTWLDAGGFDAYTNTRRAESVSESPRPADPKNFGQRKTPGEKPVPPGDFDALVGVVDQIVIHYDDSGLSRLCFDTLTKRALSAHFLVDLDGTVYQTLDLQERAFHATIANSRSIGIEMAGIGAVGPKDSRRLRSWYRADADGTVRIVPPKGIGDLGQLTPNFVARPVRPELVHDILQGDFLRQYDFTAEQYAALAKLVDALCHTFPHIERKVPRGAFGEVVRIKLTDKELASFHGILGHYHIQINKVDPGPAFQWERILPR